MKKLVTLVSSLFLVSIISAKAEMGIENNELTNVTSFFIFFLNLINLTL